MVKVKIKKLHPNAVIPAFATAGAACMDVVATRIDEIIPGKVLVSLGFATELPIGYKAIMVPRSSFTSKGWIVANSPCQIDSDYRGEWMIKYDGIPHYIVANKVSIPQICYEKFPYKVGDRVAQIYFEKVVEFQFEEAKELSLTERGEGGFGHTGL